jgi:multicomponent Na+:H+ antiporter subunit A
VDFRAFDTLGEISVVAMAALAILTLVRLRERGETQ